ncbi:MAG: hypothetical protein FWD99_00815 [Oscillospiraceae bacterium]|nr:hypothetical protein [Oscillospiraceae bacterium]
MKSRRVKIGVVTLAATLILLGTVFFLIRPQRDPQLVGGWWQFDGRYTLWLHADGRGSIEPDVPSITWRTRGGQLILTSMGVDRYYEYIISDDIKLILVTRDHNERVCRSTIFVRGVE